MACVHTHTNPVFTLWLRFIITANVKFGVWNFFLHLFSKNSRRLCQSSKEVKESQKVPILEIILSSRRPPRNRNSASLFKCFGEFLKLSPVAVPEKQSPFIHASNPALASLSIIFPLFLPFHSQSLMTSVLWRPRPPPSPIV